MRAAVTRYRFGPARAGGGQRGPRAWRLGLASAFLFLIVACAGGSPRPHEIGDNATTNLFATSYEAITDRYLDGVSLETIAISGLNGLSTIDQTVTVARIGNTVQASLRGQTIGSFPVPKSGDVRGWAVVTSDVIRVARNASVPIQTAREDAIYQAVFDAALAKLDGFSRYAGPDLAREERARRVGFGGIGLRLHSIDGRIEVETVMPDTPAAAAGIKPRDRITQVDGLNIRNWDLKDVIDRLRGPINTRVSLTVERTDLVGVLTYHLTREKIVPQTVTSRIDGRILEIKVTSFNQDTARNVTQHIVDAKQRLGGTLGGIVIDLRDNPGGLLDQAVQMADRFLASGTITSTRGRHPESFQHYDATGTDIAAGIPIAVLVNGGTASAAEVVASALQDNGRAVVIGTNSYGKGTVQTVVHLPNDGELILTWSRLVAPSGYILNKLGVMPTLCTAGSKVNVASVLDYMKRRGSETQALLSRWQTVLAPNFDGLDTLRSNCRPDKTVREIDNQVARSVLGDNSTYRQALALAPTDLAKR
ncbi:MAG: S41 family peptidase [Alphaproteobacteria bacterium]